MSQLFSSLAPIALLIGYLLGSIPFGLLVTRVAGAGDVRDIGSGSIGATNVLRTGRTELAAATLLLDALKGTFAVLGVYYKFQMQMPFEATQLAYVAGLGAVLGHMYPVWLKFEGGKGVATFIGALIALHWPAALVFGLVWCAVAAWKRYSSLAGLSGVTGVIVYYFVFGQAGMLFILIMAILIFGKHNANIKRLLAGEESKIGAKS